MINKIAVISDIHANLPALEAVLNDIHEKKISQIYCLGDLVDFAPWGNEVIEVIKRAGITCLMGNHDERIAFDKPIIPLPFHTHEEKISREKAISYSKKTITSENKMWLARLGTVKYFVYSPRPRPGAGAENFFLNFHPQSFGFIICKFYNKNYEEPKSRRVTGLNFRAD